MTNKQIVHIEYGIAFVFSFYIYTILDFPIWMFLVFLLVPDITMIGYAVNNKVGATVYNIGHSFILPLVLIFCSTFFAIDLLLLLSIIWISHIFMDRCFGYGLKYPDEFKHTHIQEI